MRNKITYVIATVLLLHAASVQASVGRDCALLNCGKAGPFPTLKAACDAIVQQNKKSQPEDWTDGEVCHLSPKPMRHYIKDCDAKNCYVIAPDLMERPLNGPVVDRAVVFSLGEHPRVYLIALHGKEGWQVMGEFGRVYDPEAFGQSDAFKIDQFDTVQLDPKSSDNILLKSTYVGSDIDQGINRISEYQVITLVLCGTDVVGSYCTRPILRYVKDDRNVLMPDMEKEVCHAQGVDCDKPHHYRLNIDADFDPSHGMITITVPNNQIPVWLNRQFADPLKNAIGRHAIKDLPRM